MYIQEGLLLFINIFSPPLWEEKVEFPEQGIEYIILDNNPGFIIDPGI